MEEEEEEGIFENLHNVVEKRKRLFICSIIIET